MGKEIKKLTNNTLVWILHKWILLRFVSIVSLLQVWNRTNISFVIISVLLRLRSLEIIDYSCWPMETPFVCSTLCSLRDTLFSEQSLQQPSLLPQPNKAVRPVGNGRGGVHQMP